MELHEPLIGASDYEAPLRPTVMAGGGASARSVTTSRRHTATCERPATPHTPPVARQLKGSAAKAQMRSSFFRVGMESTLLLWASRPSLVPSRSVALPTA